MPERAPVRTVAGQDFKVTTPSRVLYPATGTTKADVIDYYLQVSGVMLPHLHGRPATRKRWPEGVEGPEFFAKDLELGTPAWLTRVQIRHGSGPKFYPVIDTPAGLGWLGQVAALELHVPQWRIDTATPAVTAAVSTTGTTRYPDRVVFDLDPGPGAGLAECVEVALYLRERLGVLGERLVPVTSGSKGIHVYVPMDGAIDSGQAGEWARLVAEQIEQAMPDLVVSKMAKALRPGKVLIDHSQNNPQKTTVVILSRRAVRPIEMQVRVVDASIRWMTARWRTTPLPGTFSSGLMVLEVCVTDLLDITHRVLPVAVIGPGGLGPLPAYTDGQHYYFEDHAVAQAGAHLSGLLDLAGRTVTVERSSSGWHEFRGRQERQLHQRRIAGKQVFRFDDEWLFTVVRPGQPL